MGEWFVALPGLEKTFFLCAVAGGALFLIRLVMQFLGGDTDAIPDDIPDDIAADAAFDIEVMGDSDASFQMLSFQGITAFFLIFGLSGLMMRQSFEAGYILSIIVAAFCGLLIMYVQAWLMTFLLSLQSSGTIDMNNAVGAVGAVYLSIPSEGIGKVKITIQGTLKIFDATSKNNEEIKTGGRVRVVEVITGDTLVVEKA